MACEVCGGPTLGPICAKCKGERPGIMKDDGAKAAMHMMVALKHLARQPCNRKNCGTICLCAPCHARKALEFYEPDWRL